MDPAIFNSHPAGHTFIGNAGLYSAHCSDNDAEPGLVYSFCLSGSDPDCDYGQRTFAECSPLVESPWKTYFKPSWFEEQFDGDHIATCANGGVVTAICNSGGDGSDCIKKDMGEGQLPGGGGWTYVQCATPKQAQGKLIASLSERGEA